MFLHPFGTRFFGLFAVWAVFHSTLSFAAEPKPTPSSAAQSDEPLILQSYQLPPSVCNQFVANTERNRLEKTSLQKFFEGCGASFSPGSKITLDPSERILTVRQTKKGLETIEEIVSDYCNSSSLIPLQIRVEISAFQCSSNTLAKLRSETELKDNSIKSLEKSLVLLDRVTCISKCGQQVVSDSIHRTQGNPFPSRQTKASNSKALKPAPIRDPTDNTYFESTEYGTKLKFILTVGADGETIDCQLSYRLHVPISDSLKAPILDVNVKNNYQVHDGQLVILKSASIPSISKSDVSAAVDCVVIVLRANLVDPAGRLFSTLGFKKLPSIIDP